MWWELRGLVYPFVPALDCNGEKKDSCFKSYETTLERVSNRSV